MNREGWVKVFSFGISLDVSGNRNPVTWGKLGQKTELCDTNGHVKILSLFGRNHAKVNKYTGPDCTDPWLNPFIILTYRCKTAPQGIFRDCTRVHKM